MPHSLRAKLKYLTICGHIRKKDYERLCKALDNEGVLDKIKAEIHERYYIVDDDGYVHVNKYTSIWDAIRIIDKYKGEIKPQESEE